MVNKEFIVGSGGIIKDFQDRNIPQNSNNFVSVGVLIPVSEFEGLGTYGVCLATSKIVGGVETSLPSLICYSAKTLKIEGVDYIKFQCQLSIQYTNYIGQLKLTPYIIEVETLNEGEEDEEVVITTQKTFTNTTLNVIRSIASTSDASLEEPEVADNLLALIQAKNIKLIEDYKTGTKAQAIAGCFENYNASYYSGWLLIVKYSGGEFALLPYKNGADNEFTEIDLDGTYYKLYNYSSGTYDSLQLTYTKGEIDTILTSYYTKSETYSDDEVDALLDTKVDKTQKVNGHALSGDITLTKGDVGLGNVENYGIVNSPSADATNKYVDAGGLYTYLVNNFADKTDYEATQSKVNTMWAMFQDDGNSVVDTLYDLLKVFENFPETETIAPILSGIESRLDTLESMGNVVANCGSATLLSSGWASNSDSYASDYPYKITYTNILLVGATNFSVIFGVDSDTSLLSATAILDNETGTITFYASDEVQDNIAIENIVGFTNLNAINTLTTNTINQVQQNKNDIADINSNLTTYVKKQIDDEEHHTIVSNNNSSSDRNVSLQYTNFTSADNLKSFSVGVNSNVGAYLSTIKKVSGVQTSHLLKLDENGDLTLDGVDVALLPNIEIALEQVITLTTFQLTDSQYNAIVNSDVVRVVMPSDTNVYTYVKAIDSESLSNIQLNCMIMQGGTPTIYEVDIDTSTKIATLTTNTISGGGGSGIPTIELDVSQFIDQSSFTFTDSQYTEIMDAMCFNLELPNNGGNMFFIGRNNSQQASAYFYNISDNDTTSPNEIDFFNIVVNKSTKVGTLGQNAYPKSSGGSTLYQHNIFFHWQSGSYKVDVAFTIVNDDSTAMDYNGVLSYLNDNGFNTSEKVLHASGCLFVSSNYSIYGIYYSASTINIVGSANGAVQPMAAGSSFTSNWNDVVVAL